jgi:hypothetical protein
MVEAGDWRDRSDFQHPAGIAGDFGRGRDWRIMADLNANQQRALVALLSQPTIAKAAEACELGERTLYRYLGEDDFREELHERQRQILDAATAGLVGMAGDAVQALRDVLKDKETPPSVKVRAALGWLNESRKAVELGDLAERVRLLEEAIECHYKDV